MCFCKLKGDYRTVNTFIYELLGALGIIAEDGTLDEKAQSDFVEYLVLSVCRHINAMAQEDKLDGQALSGDIIFDLVSNVSFGLMSSHPALAEFRLKELYASNAFSQHIKNKTGESYLVSAFYDVGSIALGDELQGYSLVRVYEDQLLQKYQGIVNADMKENPYTHSDETYDPETGALRGYSDYRYTPMVWYRMPILADAESAYSVFKAFRFQKNNFLPGFNFLLPLQSL